MGGCSSKPKTAEFEGALAVQEGHRDDAAPNSFEKDVGGLNGTAKEQEAPGGGAQADVVQKEHCVSSDMLLEKDKTTSWAGLDGAGEPVKDRQVALVDDHKDVNHSEATHSLPIVEKDLNHLAPESSQFPKDSKSVDSSSTALKERSMASTVVPDSVVQQIEPFDSFCHSSELQVQPVISGYETPTAQGHTFFDKEASHCQDKTISLPDEATNYREQVAQMEPESPSVLKGSGSPDELQKDSEVGDEIVERMCDMNVKHKLVASPPQTKQVVTIACEAPQVSREAMTELESPEAVHENGEQRISAIMEQKNPLEKSKDCEPASMEQKNLFEKSKDFESGISVTYMPDNDIEESRRDLSAEGGGLMDKEAFGVANTVLNTSEQPSYCCSSNNHVHEQHSQSNNVDSTCIEFAEGEHLLKDVTELHQESAGEVASDDSWYILEKVCVEENHPSTMDKEHIDMGRPKDADSDGNAAPREISSYAEAGAKVPLFADRVADPLVGLAMEVKAESQPVNGMDPIGLAWKDISAQEIPARDIDEVLEKLASEFERQESLARSSTP